MRQPRIGSPSDSANEIWRMWLLTGARRQPVDRRRIRGAHVGIKRMLVEGMKARIDRPYTWKEFSDAMVRQSVGEAMQTMPREDAQLVKLAYFGGMTNREIAGNLELAEATVERRLRRAIDVISRYIERGRGLGRNALATVAVWLGGRWLSDAFDHAAPAAAVAAAAAILLVQADSPPAVTPSRPPTTTTIEQPVPSPTVPMTPRTTVPEPPTAIAPVAPVLPVDVPGVELPPVPELPKVKTVP